MRDENPYAPPKFVDLAVRDHDLQGFQLAVRSTRFAAWFVDQLLVNVFVVGILLLVGWWPLPPSWEPNYGIWFVVAGYVLSVLGFLLINGYSLKKSGQTIGKKRNGIRISDLQGNVPGFTKLILLRYLPLSLFSAISFPIYAPVVSLLDALFIFRGDRRCLHDLLAGTRVVKVTRTATELRDR